jgi:hypothetical protein
MGLVLDQHPLAILSGVKSLPDTRRPPTLG